MALNFAKARPILQEGLLRAMNRAGALFHNEAKLNVTGRILNVQSGRGRESIFWRAEITSSGGRVTVGSNVFYMKIWELTGLPARVIVPRNAKALAIPVFKLLPGRRGTKKLAKSFGGKFLKKKGSRSVGVIFRKSARIPMTPPKPWLEPAVRDNLDKAKEMIADEMAAAILKLF